MEPVVVERRDGVLTITINRPAVRNALDLAVAERIRDAADELDSDDQLRVGILAGAGAHFSAGMDLKSFTTGEVPVFAGRGLCGITYSPPTKPLVAAVEGCALAGGLELVLACDVVVASRSAQFGLPEVRRGLVAGAGGAVKLPQRIPFVVAMEMLLTGQPIGADRALQIGLVNRVVDDGQALESALDVARTIAANGPMAVTATKRIVCSVPAWPKAETWSRQAQITAPVYDSRDAIEGASAFVEGRSPRWQGR